MKVMVVSKPKKNVFKKASELAKKIKNVVFDRTTGEAHGLPWKEIEDFHGDLIITVGGDGTFLWTSHKTAVPILPLRAEGIGFLTRGDVDEVIKDPRIVTEKRYKIRKYPRLKVFGVNATNEIVITRPKPSKIIKLSVTIGNETFSFMGDGLILSTPLGSTGYNLSVGGSIIYPKLDIFSITPIAPFNSRIKPTVVPMGTDMTVELEKNDCYVIIDGHVEKYMNRGDEIKITRGTPLKLAEFKEQNFFTKLRKLMSDKRF